MRISDWSSDVCSSDLAKTRAADQRRPRQHRAQGAGQAHRAALPLGGSDGAGPAALPRRQAGARARAELGYRLRKYAGRHRWALVSGTLVVATLAAAQGIVLWQ